MLGVGATGIVVLADSVKNGHVVCQVAIKLIFAGEATRGFSETAIRRLQREGTILSRLKNQHIVTLLSFDMSASKEVFWLVMEYLDGNSLDVIMANSQENSGFVFNENNVVRLAQQVLSALDTLHQSNVIHRDIKPSNIVKIKDTDQYKVVDVGSAAVVDVRDEEVSHSLKSQRTSLNMAGTHAYIPPEGYRERHKVGPASDVWALSATLYYLLSGELPFQAQDEAGWILAVTELAVVVRALREKLSVSILSRLLIKVVPLGSCVLQYGPRRRMRWNSPFISQVDRLTLLKHR